MEDTSVDQVGELIELGAYIPKGKKYEIAYPHYRSYHHWHSLLARDDNCLLARCTFPPNKRKSN
jgi:hypothetical protein